MTFYIKLLIIGFWSLVISSQLAITNAQAVYDPTSVSNNRFGIHLISATSDESSPAATLVNSSSGDWGYVTVLVQSDDRKVDKWQNFFNDLRRKHLIPIVRLTSTPDHGVWTKPDEGEGQRWADFLDQLNWPIKNRYVTVYNEPNHATEWGGRVDPESYARVLDKTITALKAKSDDFFVMNAGFDASSPQQPPNYLDELNFMIQMDSAVPGIFNKLDGWVSHSYPNPDFSGSPDSVGRGTVRTWYWEIQTLRGLGVVKPLPIFITETGWKHSEGVTVNNNYPDSQTVGEYFKNAFNNAWNSQRIVAVTPFLLDYQQPPFDRFSFKKLSGEITESNVLGESTTPFRPQYHTLLGMSKVAGKPLQKLFAELTKGEIYSSLVYGQSYTVPLTFKNTGQSIWNQNTELRLTNNDLRMEQNFRISDGTTVEPGQEYTFNISLLVNQGASDQVKTTLQLYQDGSKFENKDWEYISTIKSPVVLIIKSALGWKNNPIGEYLLKITNLGGETLTPVSIKSEGISDPVEAKYLLPDYSFDFTLNKPYYQPKTIHQKVISGENTLNFGTLDPDIPKAILNPIELWKLLPWGN